MITRLPDETLFCAATVTGIAGLPIVQPVMSVVMRTGFTLKSNGGPVREMELTQEGAQLRTDGPQEINDPESDFACEKHRADIVVLGHMGGANGGRVQVNSATWLLRSPTASAQTQPPPPPVNGIPVPVDDWPAPPPPPDTALNLFGWHGHFEAGRNAAAGTATITVQPEVGDLLEAQYHPLLNNSYRRSDGFTAPALGRALPPSALIEIFQTADASDLAYRFQLPSALYTARLRLASPHCPDTPRRWAIAQPIEMSLDTLVVSPDAHSGHLVWRAHWLLSSFDQDRLRAVQILKTED